MSRLLLNLDGVLHDDFQPLLADVELVSLVVLDHVEDQEVAVVEYGLGDLPLLLVVLEQLPLDLLPHQVQDLENGGADVQVLQDHLVLLLGQDLALDVLYVAVLNVGDQLPQGVVHDLKLFGLDVRFDIFDWMVQKAGELV